VLVLGGTVAAQPEPPPLPPLHRPLNPEQAEVLLGTLLSGIWALAMTGAGLGMAETKFVPGLTLFVILEPDLSSLIAQRLLGLLHDAEPLRPLGPPDTPLAE
jgi:hypothetical protein